MRVDKRRGGNGKDRVTEVADETERARGADRGQ